MASLIIVTIMVFGFSATQGLSYYPETTSCSTAKAVNAIGIFRIAHGRTFLPEYCFPGYQLATGADPRCMNGKFTPTAVCEHAPGGCSTSIVDGARDETTIGNGDNFLSAHCADAFQLGGTGSSRCIDGQFQPKPVCEPKKSSCRVENVVGVAHNAVTLSSGSKFTKYLCKRGLLLASEETCKDGEFSATPRCFDPRGSCMIVGVAHGRHYDSVENGTEFTGRHCRTGFYLQRSAVCNNGKFDVMPQCAYKK